jgi:hypothetical protein
MTAVVDMVESVRSMGFSVTVGRDWTKSEDARGSVGSVNNVGSVDGIRGTERVSSSTGEFAVAIKASDFCDGKNGPTRF